MQIQFRFDHFVIQSYSKSYQHTIFLTTAHAYMHVKRKDCDHEVAQSTKGGVQSSSGERYRPYQYENKVTKTDKG